MNSIWVQNDGPGGWQIFPEFIDERPFLLGIEAARGVEGYVGVTTEVEITD
jgi:hypothetical protein